MISSNWLWLIALIVGGLLLLVLIALIRRNPISLQQNISGQVTDTGEPTSPPTSTPTSTCSSDQCVLDLITGVKRCDIQDYQPGLQACVSPYVCDYGSWYYAVQPNGSTRSDGQCAQGDACRCVRTPRCSGGTTSAFAPGDGATQSYKRVNPWLNRRGAYHEYPLPLVLEDNQFCLLSSLDINSLEGLPCEVNSMQDVYDCINNTKDSVLGICAIGYPYIHSQSLPPSSDQPYNYAIGCSNIRCNNNQIPYGINAISCASPT